MTIRLTKRDVKKPLVFEERPSSALMHGMRLEIKRLEAENAGLCKELDRAYARRQVNCQQIP